MKKKAEETNPSLYVWLLNVCILKYNSIIHNNASSSVKIDPLLSSHIKIQQYICLERILICADFSPDSDKMTFSSIEINVMDKNILKRDLFHKMLTYGLEWCGLLNYLLWCFYQLLGLTAPIHCRGSIGEQVMQWHISPNLFQWRIKLIYNLSGLNVSTSANIHLRVNYSFNNVLKTLTHKHYLYIIHGTLDKRVSAFI